MNRWIARGPIRWQPPYKSALFGAATSTSTAAQGQGQGQAPALVLRPLIRTSYGPRPRSSVDVRQFSTTSTVWNEPNKYYYEDYMDPSKTPPRPSSRANAYPDGILVQGKSNTISCTIFDSNGKITAVSKKLSKRDFLAEHGLHPRDLRHLDTAEDSIIPSILVRKDAILVNMLGLRAVIKFNEVLVLETGDQKRTSQLGLFIYDLENKLQSSTKTTTASSTDAGFSITQSYELKALESILMNTVASLDVDLHNHIKVLDEILQKLEDHVDSDLLRELLVRNKALSKFYQQSLLIRDVINDVLETDEDLAGMYLTEKHNNVFRDITDHEEAELLLESYYKQCDEIVQQADQVLSNIKSTEEIINIMLDSNRNSLMVMELKITIGTLGFSAGMFIASLYGMNLKNFMEDSTIGMAAVSSVAVVAATALTLYNLKHLRRTRKVTMTNGLRTNVMKQLQKKGSTTGLPSNTAVNSGGTGGSRPKRSLVNHLWRFLKYYRSSRLGKRPRVCSSARYSSGDRTTSWKWLTDNPRK